MPTPIPNVSLLHACGTVRDRICQALDGSDLTHAAGQPLRFTPRDFGRLL
nr:hypothetical protein [Streptomyces sp. S1D4-11]QIZ01141.1 hypothetical protein HEP87_55200 [Streptomyces sp. S1D4-11]